MQRGWGRFGGFWARFAAAFIDSLILSPFGIVARIELTSGSKTVKTCSFNATELCKGPSGSTQALYWLIVLAGIVAAVLYYGLLEGRTGQTIGKKALGLKVVDNYSGTPIGVGRAIGRYFAKILSAIPCFLGYFWMLWDPNKQTWHDKIVRSYVVAA
jgi:uncharacterized RDD family membrane protein YckC